MEQNVIGMEELESLSTLLEDLKTIGDVGEKTARLDREEKVACFAEQRSLEAFSALQQFVIKSVVAIGQGDVFFDGGRFVLDPGQELLSILLSVEEFYAEIGGIIGYHVMLLEFLRKTNRRFSIDKAKMYAPRGLDLSIPSKELQESIYHAIERMGELSEIYPIGGAADRLRLQDSLTGSHLPAALLSFNGRTLLGRLIGDLQVREYLYYKIKGKQITLPVAMMTSERENHAHVVKLFEQNHWFSRPREKFMFFSQPLVPVADSEGNWVVTAPLQPLFKPGGHGVIWKLARDKGVLAWLEAQGAVKAVIRQINNPISSEDYGLLAFAGYGLKENKRFGFASCERKVQAAEGINVVVEEEKEQGFSYTLTNIEYCDFAKYQISDEPVEPSRSHSKFPSNTNLLFVDLLSIQEALHHCPFPGMLVNLKDVVINTPQGQKREARVARLESTMQNIADYFQKQYPTRLYPEDKLDLDTYITFNKRRKTISATKREYVTGSSFLETPEGCFLDIMSNTRELLAEHSRFSLEQPMAEQENFDHPSFIFHYHPALGPLYSIIGKKLRGGSLGRGSELNLHIAECDIENLRIEGSFHVVAQKVMGGISKEGILVFDDNVGRCCLINVCIENQGIDYNRENVFWKHSIYRKELCSIVLEGHSEFYAENVTFRGNWDIRVPDGFRMIARQVDGNIVLEKEPMQRSSWIWEYAFNKDKDLELRKKIPQ